VTVSKMSISLRDVRSMTEKFPTVLRVAAIALAMMFGTIGVTSVSAQDASPVAQATSEDEDSGFDDWGLLGLLGLAGLAGLLKRPTHEVRTVDRAVPVDPRR